MGSGQDIPIVARAKGHGERRAIASEGREFSYRTLLADSEGVAVRLLEGRDDLGEARVGFLFPSGYDYVRTLWGVWRAGGIAVPLCTSHPRPELLYTLKDSGAEIVVTHADYDDQIRSIAGELGIRVASIDEKGSPGNVKLPGIDAARRAMILYTSGTTGKPKGVVSTHKTIRAQIETLIEAWGWRADDRILQMLPLHHVHGIINVMGCALWAGAVCDMIPGFDAATVWRRIEKTDLTLFMAVPTIYAKLAAAWEEAPAETRERWSAACKKFRLMVSGSAALPVQMLEKWEGISGHRLLERYGMTEIGMALSNPLNGERVAGHVGRPLPGVEVCLVDDAGAVVAEGEDGEIRVKGPSVFSEYWQRPGATAEAFEDGWFKTGDVAVVRDGIYKILGRSSVDIIKTGGYKVSALEIEEVLRGHEDIDECAVVGIPDDEWGEVVAAALVVRAGCSVESDALRRWGKSQLAPYKVPTRIRCVDSLPRNAMGKVTKADVALLFQSETGEE